MTTDKASIYKRIFNDLLKNLPKAEEELGSDTLKKLAYFGVKYVNTFGDIKTLKDIDTKMRLIQCVRYCIAELTPRELMNIFPITKEYDGDKYCSKDYFYTKDQMDKLNQDEPIGINQIDNVLWDYMNNDTLIFMTNELSTASDIRKINGQQGIVEEFCEENGIETYTLHKAANGCEYIQNNTTGRTSKVKRNFPRYLRLVK